MGIAASPTCLLLWYTVLMEEASSGCWVVHVLVHWAISLPLELVREAVMFPCTTVCVCVAFTGHVIAGPETRLSEGWNLESHRNKVMVSIPLPLLPMLFQEANYEPVVFKVL